MRWHYRRCADPYHSILCHEVAHVETDECGAAEFFPTARKCSVVNGEHGKVRPQSVEQAVSHRSDIHYPKPRALTISQATELGTVYSVAEVRNSGNCVAGSV